MSDLLSFISQMLCIKAPSEGTKSARDNSAGRAEECRVCLSRIRAGEATRRLPCRHAFHRDCVDRWLKTSCKRTCPLCRVYVVDGDRRPVAVRRAGGETSHADDLVIWFSTMIVPGF
jgi:E3 ubiquitin-protein ligase RHA2